VKLKPEYTLEDAELAMGEMCNVVKNHYRDESGFLAGQVFSYAGFVSNDVSLGGANTESHGLLASGLTEDHLIIITYWESFEQHEESRADDAFKEKFEALLEMCENAFEVGYDMLWQGEPESLDDQRQAARGMNRRQPKNVLNSQWSKHVRP
jgi:hypothetical protein